MIHSSLAHWLGTVTLESPRECCIVGHVTGEREKEREIENMRICLSSMILIWRSAAHQLEVFEVSPSLPSAVVQKPEVGLNHTK